MKKQILLCSVLCLYSISLFSQPKKYISIVKPVLYEKTKESFESIARRFEADNYKELGEIFRSFANGGHGSGFVYIDEAGENYIITNKHVVSSSEKVNLEFNEKGSTKTVYESCPIIYTDDDIDLAVIKFPNNEKVFDKAFNLSTEKQSEGKEIWSAGYPGLLGKPMWQFSKGNITNEEAFVEELVSPSVSYLIQHSASIDPGNSGGPLLIKNENVKDDYFVIGINTWTISNRQNTFFSIPTINIPNIIKKAKAIADLSSKKDSLANMLDRQCSVFAAEINSENPKWEKVNNFISYLYVADKGWESFLKVISEKDAELTKRLEKSFLNYSPVEAMRHAILYRIWQKWNFLRKEKLDIEYKGINIADKDQFESGKTVRANFTVNGLPQEITWCFEHGHWRISNYDLDKSLGNKLGNRGHKSKSSSDDNQNSFYFGVNLHFAPYVYFRNSTLSENFNIMGYGGAITFNLDESFTLFSKVSMLNLNNTMKSPPPNLTSASIKYVIYNNGMMCYFGHNKLKPYFIFGLNYMKFYETGSDGSIAITNKFERTGFQVGLGLKYSITNQIGLISEVTYNSTSIVPLLERDTDIYPNLSNLQANIGISIDLRKN